jgi:hypothetical protein
LPRVMVDKLEPGTKLAKPVTNQNGVVILGEDTELTEALIEKLQVMNIPSVYVQGLSRPAAPKEEMLAQLDKRFSAVEKEPHMDMLKRLIREHIEGLYG